jgi:hypothetical protein
MELRACQLRGAFWRETQAATRTVNPALEREADTDLCLNGLSPAAARLSYPLSAKPIRYWTVSGRVTVRTGTLGPVPLMVIV